MDYAQGIDDVLLQEGAPIAIAGQVEPLVPYLQQLHEPPKPAEPPPAPVAEVPITAHFVMRPTLGAPLYAGAEESVTGGWLRVADPQALDAPALAMYADAWWPSPLPRLTRPVTAPTIDLTVHFRAPAAAAAIAEDPVLAVFRSSTAAGGFFEEDGELWSRDGVLLAHSRQLALIVDGGR